MDGHRMLKNGVASGDKKPQPLLRTRALCSEQNSFHMDRDAWLLWTEGEGEAAAWQLPAGMHAHRSQLVSHQHSTAGVMGNGSPESTRPLRGRQLTCCASTERPV